MAGLWGKGSAMRGVMAWLVMFGVLAGLSVRAMPVPVLGGHLHGHAALVEKSDCCDHGHGQPESPGHDDPELPDPHPCHDPHHHHGCCSPGTIAAEIVRECRLSPPAGVLVGFRETRDPVPDDPYLEREAPPLI